MSTFKSKKYYSTESPLKSIKWFLHDTSYKRKAFPNRRYFKIKVNPKNEKLTCKALWQQSVIYAKQSLSSNLKN